MANTLTQNPTVATFSGATSVNKAFASGGASQSLYVAAVTQENTTATCTVSDNRNAGNYTQDRLSTGGTTNTGGAGRSSINSKQNTSTSIATITAAFSASTYGTLKIFELTNAATSSALDAAGGGGGTSTTFTGSVTTGSANSTIIAAFTTYPGGNYVADSGFSDSFTETGVNWAYHGGEYKVDAGAAGTTTLTCGQGTPANWSLAIAAYKTGVSPPPDYSPPFPNTPPAWALTRYDRNPFDLSWAPNSAALVAASTVDATVNGQTLTATASIIAGSVTATSTVAGQTLTATASLSAGAATASVTVAGVTLTVVASLPTAGAVTADSSVAGQTLTATASLLAGSASGGGSATVNGQTLTVDASLIVGSSAADSSVAGQTLTATASLLAGSASGEQNATVTGQTLTATASLLAGSATGSDPNATAAGVLLVAIASVSGGGAFGPNLGGVDVKGLGVYVGVRM